VVTHPPRVANSLLDTFVSSRSEWIAEQRERLANREVPALNEESDFHFLAHKAAARRVLVGLVDEWSKRLELYPSKVVIKRVQSRWGSCSSRGVVSFNYKLIFLSEKMQEYVVVHELCHLKEMNHSARFWALVATALPDYKETHREMHSL
jgi:hypothetical protein